MNKQEAIEKIEELKKYSRGALGDDWISLGIDKALNVVKQLDEPEKPVLSKEEAEWVDKLTEYYSLSDSLYYITRCGYGYFLVFEIAHETYELPVESDMTFGKMCRLKERLINAVLYGYEVEKEKLYTVEIPNPHDTCHVILFKNKDGNVTIEYDYDDNWETEKGYQLTEEEIKEDFAWAWQFAKEVDE